MKSTPLRDKDFVMTHCVDRKSCHACQHDPEWRDRVAQKHGLVPDFRCPFGVKGSDSACFPSIKEEAGSLLKEAGAVVKAIRHGEAIRVSRATMVERLNVCKNCTAYNKEKKRCAKCGCFVAVKTWDKAAQCPARHW